MPSPPDYYGDSKHLGTPDFTALKTQVGGSHYKDMPMQPIEFILANHLDYCTGNIIKYVTRNKNNRVEDLQKAKHYIDILIDEINQDDD